MGGAVARIVRPSRPTPAPTPAPIGCTHCTRSITGNSNKYGWL